MADTNWTPGPWEVVFDGGGSHWGMVEVVGPRVRARGFTIATDVSFEEGRRTKADAHLIAAAPELYEALDALHSAVARNVNVELASLRAVEALAKARGVTRNWSPDRGYFGEQVSA